jgi:peptidoglycan/xylan/chitin deacetylase (PgdA/CDA1 family)
MLNFKNTNIIFIALFILSAVYQLRYGLPVFAYVLLLLFYLAILFWGSYWVGSGFYFRIICSANTSKKEIAISFDDGPVPEYTPEILRLLKENQVQAAFFCIGKRIEGNEILFNRIHEEGHIIGNHSYSHDRWFDLFSSNKMAADLQKMNLETKRVCGLIPRFFRPPYGVTNPPLGRAIKAGNFIPIGWSIRSLDTVRKNEKKMLRKILGSLQPGAIILFHDTSKTTLAVLPEFFKLASGAGYEIVRLDKLLKLDPYA